MDELPNAAGGDTYCREETCRAVMCHAIGKRAVMWLAVTCRWATYRMTTCRDLSCGGVTCHAVTWRDVTYRDSLCRRAKCRDLRYCYVTLHFATLYDKLRTANAFQLINQDCGVKSKRLLNLNWFLISGESCKSLLELYLDISQNIIQHFSPRFVFFTTPVQSLIHLCS